MKRWREAREIHTLLNKLNGYRKMMHDGNTPYCPIFFSRSKSASLR
ncbi:MAG: hypothetical protein CNLJKLNK_00794 [Holosporales bacterium]